MLLCLLAEPIGRIDLLLPKCFQSCCQLLLVLQRREIDIASLPTASQLAHTKLLLLKLLQIVYLLLLLLLLLVVHATEYMLVLLNKCKLSK